MSGLSATGAWQAGQMVVHTSGRHGASVLDPVLDVMQIMPTFAYLAPLVLVLK